MKHTKTFTVEIEVEASYHVDKDPAYGADLDGRRGEVRRFVEDVTILTKPPEIMTLIEDAVEEQIDPSECD